MLRVVRKQALVVVIQASVLEGLDDRVFCRGDRLRLHRLHRLHDIRVAIG